MAIFTILFFLNVLAFGLYGYDKHQAVYKGWRIPEAVLLGLAVLGGAYGAAMGMALFRHKTRHKAFLITIPVFFFIWLAISIFLLLA